MKPLFLAAMLCTASSAFAQIRVEIGLPTITFPAPPHLVFAEPGVQVVEDYDEEVFFADDYYWHRRGNEWFRTRRHDGGWDTVEPRLVPRAIVAVPVGKYRHWKHEVREERHEEKHEKHEDKREEKHEEKHEKKGKH